MHMSDTDRGFISTSAIVGGSISLSTGAGFALKTQGGDAVAVGLFGDGALEEGVVLRVAQPGGAVVAAGRVRVREQQRGRARLGRRRLPHLGVRGRRPDEDPARPSGSRSRRSTAATWRRCTTSPRARVEHCPRAQGPVLRPRGHRPLRRHAAALAERCRPARRTSRWPGTTSGMAGEHEAWYREHDPVLRYARELLASGDIGQDELTELDAQVTRADRRGAPVRAGQPAAHPRERTRPRLRLRRRRSWPPRTTPTRCWTSSGRSWRRTRSSR